MKSDSADSSTMTSRILVSFYETLSINCIYSGCMEHGRIWLSFKDYTHAGTVTKSIYAVMHKSAPVPYQAINATEANGRKQRGVWNHLALAGGQKFLL